MKNLYKLPGSKKYIFVFFVTLMLSIFISDTLISQDAIPENTNLNSTLNQEKNKVIPIQQLNTSTKTKSGFLKIYSGNKQSSETATFLKEAFIVKLSDENKKALPGIKIKFSIIHLPSKSKGAELSSETVISNKDGLAKINFKLGSKKGLYYVSASIDDKTEIQNSNTVIFKSKARASNWIVSLLIGLFGGLALFLYGMELMSEGMSKSAGAKMRTILAKLTANRFVGLLAGAFVTMIIQSSSATTVMLVSFVQAGLMSFTSSLGVILGADIGTTITAQMVAFKITKYALVFVAAGFAIIFISKSPAKKNAGESILGFGLLFFGMLIMSEAMHPLRTYTPFINLLLELEHPLLGVLIGALFTALIQSSSAFIGIIIVLASQGLLSLNAGIALMLGSNIGTSITAVLASLNAGREAKRVAMAHTLFKVFGVLLVLFWIPDFAKLVKNFSPLEVSHAPVGSPEFMANFVPRQIANAHTFFNIAMALIFLPFTRYFASFIYKLLPDLQHEKKELQPRTWHLDDRIIETPSLALHLAHSELLRMFTITRKMLLDSIEPFFFYDKNTNKKTKPKNITKNSKSKELQLLDSLLFMETEIDFLNDRIYKYLVKISKRELNQYQSAELFCMVNIVNNLESIADIIDKNIIPLSSKMIKSESRFSSAGKEEIQIYHIKVVKQIARCRDAFEGCDKEKAKSILVKEHKYNRLESAYKLTHFDRVKNAISQSLETHNIHLDLIHLLQEINVHTAGIAKLILEVKKKDVEHDQ